MIKEPFVYLYACTSSVYYPLSYIDEQIIITNALVIL